MRIKKGDKVKVLYGKDSGKTGVVLSVKPLLGKLVVDGVNIFKRNVKGDGKTRKSEIINIVKPMAISKVMLVCPNCNKATRVGIKRDGKKSERVCKKCNKSLDSKPVVKKEVTEKKTVTKKKVVKKTAKK